MGNEKDEDEISIDLSKITNFFKKKKKGQVEEIKKEEKQIERKIEEEKKRLEKDEKAIQDIKEEIKTEEKEAENIDKKEEKFEKEIKETKKRIDEVKEGVEKDDDEIEIDFSKIKGFFKRKKTEKTEAKKIQAEENEDEEISFDFSKIKNIFKGKGKETADDEDTIAIDWKKTIGLMKKYQIVLLLLIPLFLSIFLRVQSAYLPVTDDWANDAVMDNLRNQVRSQIQQNSPNLPSNFLDTQVDAQVQKLLKEQKSQIQQQIEGTSNYFKSRLQDDSGTTYLLAIDPWFWMRHARNVLNNGHPGDEIRDNMSWDNHMFAPQGRPVPPDMFHAYFEAYLYKFLSFFNKDIELMKVVFYVPVLLSALSVIPAFFITRRLGGNFGGFIGAVIVAIHPAFLSRTAGGFADTDAYNILFPLLITWFFLEALESKNFKKNIILSSLSGILVGFFAFSWGGWWFIFDFIVLSTLIYLVYYSIIHRKKLSNFLKKAEIKNVLMVLLLFILFSGIFTSIFKGTNAFLREPISNPLGFAKMKEVGITTVWPNVYTTVAEQNPASLNSIIDQIGMGKWLFLLIALVGIVLTTTKLKEKKPWFIIGTLAWYVIIFGIKPQNLTTFLILISIPIVVRLTLAIIESDTEIDLKYAILLIIWLTSTIYASVKGVRFMLLLVPPFAIGFGIALGQLYRYSSKWFTKGFSINKYISNIVIILILLLIAGTVPVPFSPYCLGSTCKQALDVSKQEIPSMNDAWYSSLTKIKQESKPDAIINSWWDFGHWFKYIGDRAVTFDGTSQNTPMAHWIGNTLLTSDEDTARGILRMLDCSGGSYAYTAVYDIIKDEPRSVDIIYQITKVDKEKAREILSKNNFKEEKIIEIMNYTHCEPPENYFITSEDMIGKSGVWSHFGSWDFDRALIYKTLKKKEFQNDITSSTNFLQKRFNYSKSEAENMYYEVQGITDSQQANNWIAPWPGYAGIIGCSKINNETLKCSDYLINLSSYDIYIPTSEGKRYPKKASFQTDEDLIVKNYTESVINMQNGRGLGTALIKNGDSYTLLQMDEALTASIFTRLFYMEGIGLKHFKKFSDERGITGGRIIVWKVDWEGKEKNVVTSPEPEVKEETPEKTEKNAAKTDNTSQNISDESL